MSVWIQARNNWLTYLSGFLFATFIVLLPSYTDVAKKVFYLLGIISLSFCVKNFKNLEPVHPIIKLFFIVIFLNFLWILFTFYLNGSPGRGSSFIWGRQAHLLLLIPLFYLFSEIKLPENVLWISVILSLFLGLYTGYQDVQFGSGRAQGGMHPILFGSIVLCMSMYMLVMSFQKPGILAKVISLIAFCAGTLLVIWTEARGVWVALPVLLAIAGLLVLKQFSKKIRWIAVVCFFGILSMAAIHPEVEKQFVRTLNSLQAYDSAVAVNDPGRGTSLGTRFEMWKASWAIFQDNPVFGVGLGGYQQSAEENAKAYNVSSSAYWFYHPHNQYLSALSTRGILGGIMLLAMLVIPILYVYKNRRDKNAHIYGMILILMSIAYMIYGLSDVPLEGKTTILFFSVFWAYLLSSYRENKSGEK